MGNIARTKTDIALLEAKAKRYIELEGDPKFTDEVQQLLTARNKKKKLQEAFGTELEFGTGGLRGIIGGGLNRMNPYVVGRAAQGVALYLTEREHKGTRNKPLQAVIAYDARHYSREFAEVCAEVCAAHGIVASLFDAPRPTPLLSFAVRALNADVGLMITASHNPPEYNGCKVYWKGGAQVIPPHDQNITAKIHASEEVKRMGLAAAKKQGLMKRLGGEIDQQYCDYIYTMSLNNELVAAEAAKLSITYTPLHGVGIQLFRTLADHLGYHYNIVKQQMEPDGDFPTVTSPNPENPEALSLAIQQGKQNGSDIILANDPDADRIAVAVWHDKEYHILSGNQVGVLLIDYALNRHTTLGTMPKNPAVIKTIVTTELQRIISESYGVPCYDTLTGFKHIAAKIAEFEQTNDGPQFIIGGEESIGYMHGLAVRDKDGIGVAMLLMEMALHYKCNGISLIDQLHKLYIEHGYFEEVTISKVLPGVDGSQKMAKIMEQMRKNPPRLIHEIAVNEVRDYQAQKVIDCATRMEKPLIGFPVSNVLQFHLADSSVVSARPSGTEPKIKFYISCHFIPHVPLEQARLITQGMITEIQSLIDTWIEAAG